MTVLNYRGYLENTAVGIFHPPPVPRFSVDRLSAKLLAALALMLAVQVYFSWGGGLSAFIYLPFPLLALATAFSVNGMRFYFEEKAFFSLFALLTYAAAILIVLRSGEKHSKSVTGESISGSLGRLSDRAVLFLTPRNIALAGLGLLGIFYFVFFLVLNKVPLGHDTLQYQQLQYTFLNEVITKGDIPLWLPFMTKGTVSNWWFLLQNSLISGLYYTFAPLLSSVNLYYLFGISMYADEAVFLLGVVLLSGLLYRRGWTVAFATLAAVIPSVWAFQIWHNFHYYYLLPFIFYFTLRFIRSARWQWLLAACLTVAISFYGNLPYFFPVISLATFMFAVGMSAAHWKEFPGKLRAEPRLRLLGGLLLSVAASGVLLAVIHSFLKGMGAEEIAISHLGRDSSGKVLLADFLSYGGNIGWGKYLGLATGLSPNLDSTLYSGLLVPVFACLQLFYLMTRRKAEPASHVFLALTAFFISFSTGGICAKAAYYFWPTMDLYRHIGLTGGVVRIFLVFYAAYGFESFLEGLEAGRGGEWRRPVWVALGTLASAKMLIFFQPLFPAVFSEVAYSAALRSSMLGAAAALTLFWLLRVTEDGRGGKLAAALLLSFLIADTAFYRASVYNAILQPAAPEYSATFKPYKYSYAETRSQKYGENARFAALNSNSRKCDKAIPAAWRRYSYRTGSDGSFEFGGAALWPFGSVYWNAESFFYFDACNTIFRCDNVVRSVSDFLAVYRSAHDLCNLEFPVPAHPGYKKTIGCGAPKLRLFSAMTAVPDMEKLKAVLSDREFAGDRLYFNGSAGPVPVKAFEEGGLSKSEEVPGNMTVTDFSSNRVRVRVENPLKTDAVLFYSDAWHKNWHAFVDGKETRVFTANIGFKAVVVPPGMSEVEFVFGSPVVKIAAWGLAFFGAGMLLFFVGFSVRALRKGP